MKKNLLFLLSISLFAVQGFAQITYADLGTDAQHADISVIDWDKDGDLDLLISGESGGVISLNAYLNDGSGNYTLTTVPFRAVTRGAIDWNDINQDGNPDLLQNGFVPGGIYAGIFTSDASNVFTESSIALPQMSPTSGFADFNNDGYTDIYVCGNDDQGKSKILFNDKAGSFVDQHTFDGYTFKFDPDISVVDYDNDKDLDIYISASETADGSRFSRLFQNTNGVFTETFTFLPEKGYGSSTWGDYDGDGFLDLLCNGVGTPGDDFKYRIYKNNSGTSFSIVDSYIYGQFSTGDGARWFDWDNDGDLDFIVTGWTGSRQATAIYLNTAGIFSEHIENPSLPGVSESSIEVADVDNDSDLDVFITGFSNNDFDGAGTTGPYNRNVSLLIRNPTILPNLAPFAPTNLNATGDQAAVTLSWSAAVDLTTPINALSYNIYLVDGNGKWFYYPLADTATGKLQLQRMGNVNLNLGWIIKGLPEGSYKWGVQAIDNSFMGSAFATSTFTINADGTLPVSLSSYTAKADGKKSKIEWVTASEQNNGYFEIERSSDNVNFYKIATVEGKGTTASVNHYVAYDNNPSAGQNFYRLVQYNVDGKPTTFGIKKLVFDIASAASVVVYPNPARTNVGIRLNNFRGKQVTVSVTDLMGKLVHRQIIAASNGQGYYPIHFTSKPVSGQYLLSVNGEGLKQTLKLIIK